MPIALHEAGQKRFFGEPSPRKFLYHTNVIEITGQKTGKSPPKNTRIASPVLEGFLPACENQLCHSLICRPQRIGMNMRVPLDHLLSLVAQSRLNSP